MWTIYEKKAISKIIKRIPIQIRKHYELWKRIVEIEGPQGLKLIKGMNDEALVGNLKGYRSSRLSLQWRVIYKVEKDYCEVYVIDINPHQYKMR